MIWLESLLNTLTQTGVCYSDAALSSSQRQSWLEVLKSHQTLGQFKPASVGQGSALQLNSTIRNDQISWLENQSRDDQGILAELELWKNYLNENLFLSARTIEAHFAVYEAGHFYNRHIDQKTGLANSTRTIGSKSSQTYGSKTSRVLTFVVYLHAAWKSADGGELVVTEGDTNLIKQIIEPLPGRVVIFRSDEVWHEVRKSNFTRSSLTGWFRYDADAFTPPASAI